MKEKFNLLFWLFVYSQHTLCQELSIEIDKNEYTMGEQIHALFILSNSTASDIQIDGFDDSYNNFQWILEGDGRVGKNAFKPLIFYWRIYGFGNSKITLEANAVKDIDCIITSGTVGIPFKNLPSPEDSKGHLQPWIRCMYNYLNPGKYNIKATFDIKNHKNETIKKLECEKNFIVKEPEEKEKEAFESLKKIIAFMQFGPYVGYHYDNVINEFEKFKNLYPNSVYLETIDEIFARVGSLSMIYDGKGEDLSLKQILKYPNKINSISLFSAYRSARAIQNNLPRLRGTKIEQYMRKCGWNEELRKMYEEAPNNK